MPSHIHITEKGEPIATLWLDAQGHVQDDGSIAARNAVGNLPHGLRREHGQKLLNAVVEALDRTTYLGAYHCDKHDLPKQHEHERRNTEPTPQDAWPEFGGLSPDEQKHRDVSISNDYYPGV